MLSGLSGQTYEEKLCELNLDSLSQRRQQADLVISVADPGCLSRIPDPTFLVIPDPGSGSRILHKKVRC
jgi:hypothetical protein